MLQKVAQAFTLSGGNLRTTIRAIFQDPAFATASTTRNKVHDGFELVVNTLRRAQPTNVSLAAVNNRIAALRSQPHQNPVPTGYPEVGRAWQGAGNVLPRWKFAYDFAHLCPLITSAHPISDRFVAQCIAMWRKLFAFDAAELAFYAGCSRTLRRQFGRRHEPIPVFTEAGVVVYPTSRRRR